MSEERQNNKPRHDIPHCRRHKKQKKIKNEESYNNWGDIWQATLSGRNDLEPIAAAICPAITDILNILARANPAMVRMSGSGATCFALFNEAKDLDAAKANLDPRWWSMGTELR